MKNPVSHRISEKEVESLAKVAGAADVIHQQTRLKITVDLKAGLKYTASGGILLTR